MYGSISRNRTSSNESKDAEKGLMIEGTSAESARKDASKRKFTSSAAVCMFVVCGTLIWKDSIRFPLSKKYVVKSLVATSKPDPLKLGCYTFDYDKFSLNVVTSDDRVKMLHNCAQSCTKYDYFAVTPDHNRCMCIYKYPGFEKLIARGDCVDEHYDYDTSVTEPGKMNLYVIEHSSTGISCTNSGLKDLASRLISTGGFKTGYDIIANKAKSGHIFESNLLDCGTSVFRIESMVGGSSEKAFTTTSSLKRSREAVSTSISSSLDFRVEGLPLTGGVMNPIAGLSANVYGSASMELNIDYNTEVSQFKKSKFFQSKDVRTFAKISLRDKFHNERNQYDLNKHFIESLEEYFNSKYDEAKALEIINEYGMLIMDEIVVGGYWQHTSAMTESSYEKLKEFSSDAKGCVTKGIETKQSGILSGLGVNPFPTVDAEVSVCFGAKIEEANKILKTAAEATETTSYAGCTAPGCKVSGSVALPLPLDMYPKFQKAIYRPLYAFLSPGKINPLNFHIITPDEFKSIQKHLHTAYEKHFSKITDLLERGTCFECETPYLEQKKNSMGQFSCKCHNEVSEPLTENNLPCNYNYDCQSFFCERNTCKDLWKKSYYYPGTAICHPGWLQNHPIRGNISYPVPRDYVLSFTIEPIKSSWATGLTEKSIIEIVTDEYTSDDNYVKPLLILSVSYKAIVGNELLICTKSKCINGPTLSFNKRYNIKVTMIGSTLTLDMQGRKASEEFTPIEISKGAQIYIGDFSINNPNAPLLLNYEKISVDMKISNVAYEPACKEDAHCVTGVCIGDSCREDLVYVGANPERTLYNCQGDCDSDNDCADGLNCYERDDGDDAPPGCSGYSFGYDDYCVYKPECPGVDSKFIRNIDPDPRCALHKCQGDCDTNGQCGDGLSCHHRNEGGLPPPGCVGVPYKNYDYCI